MGMQAAFNVVEIYSLFELSNRIDVEFSQADGEPITTYENCYFCKFNSNHGFAFALMSDDKCLEFYATEKDRVDIFILELGGDEPSLIGRASFNSEIEMDEVKGDTVSTIFETVNFKIKLSVKQHNLKMNPERLNNYLGKPGDSLNIKYFQARNFVERLKWDSVGKEVSIAGIENDQITQFWETVALYSMNIGGPEEFAIEFVNAGAGSSKNLLINLVDENNQIPSAGKYTSLGYRVSMIGDDILRLRTDNIQRIEDHEEIVYFFKEASDAVAIHISKAVQAKQKNYPYEMFTAITYRG